LWERGRTKNYVWKRESASNKKKFGEFIKKKHWRGRGTVRKRERRSEREGDLRKQIWRGRGII
jgi:hypothetical protein